jgi:hypothetical protein
MRNNYRYTPGDTVLDLSNYQITKKMLSFFIRVPNFFLGDCKSSNVAVVEECIHPKSYIIPDLHKLLTHPWGYKQPQKHRDKSLKTKMSFYDICLLPFRL